MLFLEGNVWRDLRLNQNFIYQYFLIPIFVFVIILDLKVILRSSILSKRYDSLKQDFRKLATFYKINSMLGIFKVCLDISLNNI